MTPFIKKIILPVLFFVGFVLLYVHNLSRSVYGGDIGDLVTAAAVGGVAHPPGYPLFTLLGFLLVHIPFLAFSPAFAVGLISAFSASLGLVCFYTITYLLTKRKLASGISTLVLGFSFLYWFYSEIAEVFALNVFFALLLFLFALLYRKTKKTFLLFFLLFFVGLSCTHHQTIILLFPSLLLLIGKNLIFLTRRNYLFVLYYVLLFILGFSPYLYVVIASSHNPVINWDTVHNIPSFLHLVLRRDYGTFQAGVFEDHSIGQRFITIKVYLQYLLFQETIPVVFLSLLGMWRLFVKDKIVCFSLLLAWILTGPFFLTYAAFPLTGGFFLGTYERFVLLSFVLSLIPFGVGLVYFSEYLSRFLPKRNYAILFQLVFLFIPIMLFFYNFPKTNLSQLMIGDTYAKDFLDTLPPHAVLLISGDTQIFNTWYVHYALHDRPDILLYNIGAAPLQDTLIAPQLVGVSSKEKFEKLLHTFMILQGKRPIFSTSQYQPKSGEKIIWVPYGTSYRMFLQGDTLPTKEEFRKSALSLLGSMHIPSKKDMEEVVFHNLTIGEIPTYYSNNLIATGTFAYSQYQDTQTALDFYQKAKEIAPTNARAYNALSIIDAAMGNRCEEIVTNLTTSLSLDRLQEFPYVLLYSTYATCLKDTNAAENVKKEFVNVFQKDFQKELESVTADVQSLQKQ
ncbi:MAG TPA: DUF2723 domain-containing protein [Candidatus Eisenbacteria bacterium]|nr:DUF2723 domain-containing protein [Candidatus Eisenbacteria bacterium]